MVRSTVSRVWREMPVGMVRMRVAMMLKGHGAVRDMVRSGMVLSRRHRRRRVHHHRRLLVLLLHALGEKKKR